MQAMFIVLLPVRPKALVPLLAAQGPVLLQLLQLWAVLTELSPPLDADADHEVDKQTEQAPSFRHLFVSFIMHDKVVRRILMKRHVVARIECRRLRSSYR